MSISAGFTTGPSYGVSKVFLENTIMYLRSVINHIDHTLHFYKQNVIKRPKTQSIWLEEIPVQISDKK